MVNKTVTFSDVEDPLGHAAANCTLASEFIWNLLQENEGKGSLSKDRVYAARYVLENAEEAARAASEVYYAAFAQNGSAAFGKTPAAPSVSVELGAGLEDLRQQLEICFMASAALPDEDDQTAMRTALSRALDLLTAAERHLQ